MQLAEYQRGLDSWLDENSDELALEYVGHGTMEQQLAQLSKVRQIAWAAGWMRWGWPESVGGYGGSSLFRAYLGEALTDRDLVEASYWWHARGPRSVVSEVCPRGVSR